jgi:hypothetical protein
MTGVVSTLGGEGGELTGSDAASLVGSGIAVSGVNSLAARIVSIAVGVGGSEAEDNSCVSGVNFCSADAISLATTCVAEGSLLGSVATCCGSRSTRVTSHRKGSDRNGTGS